MEAKETTISTQEGVILAHVESPNFEEAHSQAILEGLLAAVKETPSVPILLNLSKVSFMPSMSIGALVTLWKELKDSGSRFILVGVQAPVRHALAVCRLDKLFEFSDTEQEARRRLRPTAV